MKDIDFSTSACRYCRFYQPEGRRGGSCQKLGVTVQSSWKACALASPPFETTIEKLEDIFYLNTPVQVESNRAISSKVPNLEIENSLQDAFYLESK